MQMLFSSFLYNFSCIATTKTCLSRPLSLCVGVYNFLSVKKGTKTIETRTIL